MVQESSAKFLTHALPEWSNEEVVQARFRAFSRSDENFEAHLSFWHHAILLMARRYYDCAILKVEELRDVAFKRNGLTPLSLDQVLIELHRRGQLQRLSEVRASYSASWIQWSIAQLARSAKLAKQVVGSLIQSESAEEWRLEGEIVVLEVLKEHADKADSEISQAAGVLLLDPLLQSFHPNPQEALLILHELRHRRRIALVSIIAAGKEVWGVKVAAKGEKHVSKISERDHQRLHLKHTLQGLEERGGTLMQRSQEARQQAVTAVQAKDRPLALRCIKRQKLWEKASSECHAYAAKSEELLLQLDQAEVTRQVTSALNVGAEALRTTTVTLEEAELCLEQVDGALRSQREVQELLGSAVQDDSDATDQELAQLEAEVALERLTLDSAKKMPQSIELGEMRAGASAVATHEQRTERDDGAQRGPLIGG